MTTFSFHPVKPITTGEGGAVVTNSKELYEKMLSYADEHGLRLTGYSFESELPDYPIASEKEYITQVMIKIVEQS